MTDMKGCPYTQKPCPGNAEGCAAWGRWEKIMGAAYQTQTVYGCTIFSWGEEHMTIAPAKKIPAEKKPKQRGRPRTKPKPEMAGANK